MFQVLPVSSKVADGMARDDRFKKISFTGSSEIGWYLKGLDPKKRVTLELGGNAGVIVHSDADLDFAAQRIAFGGYYQAGQSCISVQRVLVASEVYDDFAARLTKQVESLKVGDPMDPTVDVGPVIQAQEVERIQGWVDEAVSQGAQVLTGGTGEGPIFQPTLIADVKPEMKVCRDSGSERREAGQSTRFEISRLEFDEADASLESIRLLNLQTGRSTRCHGRRIRGCRKAMGRYRRQYRRIWL